MTSPGRRDDHPDPRRRQRRPERPSSTRLLADRLTAATVEALSAAGDDATVEVELRAHARDLADNLVAGFPNEALRSAIDTVSGADGLIAVTPIFSASYSGLFKTFFDVLDKDALSEAGAARRDRRSPPGTRWPSSTPSARCSPTCGRSPCRRRCSPPRRTGPERWGRPRFCHRIDRAAGELADLVTGRPASARPVDPFADPETSFEDLLRGH